MHFEGNTALSTDKLDLVFFSIRHGYHVLSACSFSHVQSDINFEVIILMRAMKIMGKSKSNSCVSVCMWHAKKKCILRDQNKLLQKEIVSFERACRIFPHFCTLDNTLKIANNESHEGRERAVAQGAWIAVLPVCRRKNHHWWGTCFEFRKFLLFTAGTGAENLKQILLCSITTAFFPRKESTYELKVIE